MNRNPQLATALAFLLGMGMATTSSSQTPPQVATPTDSQHNFLTFADYQTVNESPNTSIAYYNAVDPLKKKVDVRDWLVNAGFIKNRDDWRPSGQQIYTNIPGDYGPNKINAYAHMIALNAADLGFFRNQYVRCNPDCKTKGATIYTYLENYPVPKAAQGDITKTRVAINAALETRNVGDPDTGRIADVAFEWAPAADGSSPSTLFGQLYSFVVHATKDTSGNIVKVDELYNWPDDQPFWDANFNNLLFPTPNPFNFPAGNTNVGLNGLPNPTFLFPRPGYLVYSGQPFAPQLDSLGTKAHPGVCYICHGGNVPGTVQTTLVWPNNGRDKEFKFLPVTNVNMVFGIDDSGMPTVAGAVGQNLTQAAQEIEIKKYNQVVAITQGATPPRNAVFAADGTITGGNWTVPKTRDDQGVLRPSHALEAIFGWYALDPTNPADLAMGASVENNAEKWIPVGWRNADGPTLYSKVIKFSCATCHMNREQSLDLGTLAQFDNNKGNIQDFIFTPECASNQNQVSPGKIVMPLARLTWDRFWNGIDPATHLELDAAHSLAPNDPNSQPFILKQHFGYTATSFCAAAH